MDQNSKEKEKPIIKRQLTIQEQQAIAGVKEKGVENPRPIFRTSKESGNMELAIDERLERDEAMNLLNSRILNATGAVNNIVGIQLLTNAGKATISAKIQGKELTNQLDTLYQYMHALAPQDEYEGQLIAQLIVLHEQAMDWLGRAMRTERVDFANVYLNGASKLLTRHHETLDMLLKYRRKGEQRVHVEHVHVYGGGQAIVGNVNAGSRINPKTEEGPHAKV